MRVRVLFVLRYFLFWVGYFLVAKLLFLGYHWSQTTALPLPTIAGILRHGLPLDGAVAAYLTGVALVFMVLSVVLSPRLIRDGLSLFTCCALGIATLVITVDLELYTVWGFRIDRTVLRYFSIPREMLASASIAPVPVLVGIALSLMALASSLFWWGLRPALHALPSCSPGTTVSLLCLFVPCVLIGRGGWQQIPINQSRAYFSTHAFANHAGLNVVWHFFDSLYHAKHRTRNPYDHIPLPEAQQRLAALLTPSQAPRMQLLNTARPNIILIIWESLTAKIVPSLGGLPGVTPSLEQLIPEGVLFTQLYASGDRSDKGLVAIFSGFPAQPRTSIMLDPKKTASLPFLSADLAGAGYATRFYYGGELAFANLNAYLRHGHMHHIYGKEAFPPQQWNAKWGAHDHVVLERLWHDTRNAPTPFFHTIFTLSSHEPFDIPIPAAFPGTNRQSQFLSAHAYTDRSIGAFIARAKTAPWWSNTLVIILADHGHPLPNATARIRSQKIPAEFHIPMLWLGGAIAQPGTMLDQIGSQTDFAPTLLGQLALDSSAYRWGRDLLVPQPQAFAYYAFHEGFGYSNTQGKLVYENAAKTVIHHEGTYDDAMLRNGLAYLRLSVQDYLER